MSELDSVKAPSEGTVSPQERARIARESLVGKSVQGRYVLRSLLGHGGMGAVYEAEHLGIGKRVAIKFVDSEFVSDEQVVTRFAREARAMSTIESPHIVSIFDAGTEDGRPYLVMELLRGEDLGQRLRRTERVALAESLHIIAMVLKGLAKAHAAGIVHRDLKPDNIFLVQNDGDPVFAKIVDFGVSKIERPRNRTSPLALTGRGTVLGTPFYMSPEQAQAVADLDGRADIFSVGAILFECLAGRPPHTGETYEQIILSICMTDAPPLAKLAPDVPAPVAAFVAKALSRERSERFASAEEMLAALHELSPEEKKRVPLESFGNKTAVAGSAPVAAGMTMGLPGSTNLKAVATQVGQPTAAATPVNVAAVAVAVPQSAVPSSGAPGSAVPSSGPPGSGPGSGPRSGAAAQGAGARVVITPAPRDELPLEPAGVPKARPRTTLVVTSIIAIALGVGLTFAVVNALDKGGSSPAPSGAPSSAAPSATPSASPAVSASSEKPAPSASASSKAPSPALSAGMAPKPHPSAPPKPSAKGLDISRDLP